MKEFTYKLANYTGVDITTGSGTVIRSEGLAKLKYQRIGLGDLELESGERIPQGLNFHEGLEGLPKELVKGTFYIVNPMVKSYSGDDQHITVHYIRGEFFGFNR